MKNYTEEANAAFSKKMLEGFVYVAPANYLKTFLLDYFKRDIKNLVDILLIKGKWATQVASQQLSDSLYAIMEISTELVEFDESLSEESARGKSLKNILSRSNKDKNSTIILRRMLNEINGAVLRMITETARNLIIMGRSLKAILEGPGGKKGTKLIINWEELGSSAKMNIRAEISEVYKKIYYFVQLLQFFFQKEIAGFGVWKG